MLKSVHLVALMVGGSAMAQSQRIPPMADSSAAQIAGRIHSNLPEHRRMGFVWVSDILRQEGKPQPLPKLDAIADALTDVVLEESDRSTHALAMLSHAGHPSDSMRSGTAYPGTLERLIRIHQQGTKTPGVRTSALMNMTAFAGSLPYLRSVAVSTDPSAVFALGHLISVAQNGGLDGLLASQKGETQATLRDIFMRSLTRERFADEAMLVYGTSQGWRRD
jgi:hypothetical protein